MNANPAENSCSANRRLRRMILLALELTAAALILAAAWPRWLPLLSQFLTPIRIEADGPLWKRPLGLTLHLDPRYGTLRAAVSAVYPQILIERLLWIPPGDVTPAVEATRVTLDGLRTPQLPPARALHIGSLSLNLIRLSDVILERDIKNASPAPTPEPPPSWPATIENFFRWLPESIRVHHIQLLSPSPAGPLTLEGFPLDIRTAHSPDTCSCTVSISGSSGRIRTAQQSLPLTLNLTAHLNSSPSAGQADTSLRLAFAGQPELAGSLNAAWDSLGIARVSLSLDQGALEKPAAPLLSRLISGGAAAFDRLDLEPLSLQCSRTQTGRRLTSAAGRARLTALQLGPDSAPWYRGNLVFAGSLDTDGRLSALLQLDQAGRAEIQTVPADSHHRLTLVLSPCRPRLWSRAIPRLEPWLTPWEPWLPEQLDIHLEANASWSGGRPRIEHISGRCTAAWPPPGAAARWTLDMQYSPDAFLLRLRDPDSPESLTLSADGPPPAWHALTLRANRIDPSRWLRLIRGWDTLNPLSGAWSGNITLNPKGPELRWQAAPDSDPAWNGRPLGTSGQVRSAGRLCRNGDRWLLDATAQLSNRTRIAIETAQWLGGTQFQGLWRIPAADAAELTRPIGLDALWGEFVMPDAGRFEFEYGRLAWETADISAPSLGWGAYFLPPDWILRAQAAGEIRWDQPGGWSARIEQVRAETNHDHLALEQLTAAPDSITLNRIELLSDLAPLTHWGWLSDAQNAELHLMIPSLTLPMSPSAAPWTAALEYRASADRLSLWNGRVTLEGPNTSGRFERTDDGRLSGDGSMAIAAAKTPAGTFTDISGRLAASGSRIYTENLTASAWNGTIAGQLSVQPFEPAMPARGAFRMRNLRLDRFCDEVKPPYIRLEGLLNGWSRFALETLHPVHFRLRAAADSGFSVNTDFVRQLILSQQVADYTGGRQAAAVLLDVLGSGPQRPFDAGALDLRLAEERLAGVLTFKSRNLNLTLDIKADPLALLDALETAGKNQEDPGR